MNTARRWPLHPQPGPLESLSSWLERLARPYEIRVEDLLTRNLGLDMPVPDDLDYDPPAAMLAALAMRTGVETARLRAMTLAGWEPWLIEGLTAPIEDTQPVFDAYVRDNSVLLAPGKAGVNKVSPFPALAGAVAGVLGAVPGLPRMRRRSRTREGPGVAAAPGDRLVRARVPPRGRHTSPPVGRLRPQGPGPDAARRTSGHRGPLHLRRAHHRAGRPPGPHRARRGVVPAAAVPAR
ncbi:TniQ family protein [Streptomyces violaceusniger]|uniref:TniQ domain-containing protein n=1 Tax=Streptomyces violaceusniger TaxID=68280 RepID=A0A4D4LPS4_STRVO|nr:hypothetical protein SVIO_110810 [Streptomyces violaceusniger]